MKIGTVAKQRRRPLLPSYSERPKIVGHVYRDPVSGDVFVLPITANGTRRHSFAITTPSPIGGDLW